MVTEIQAGMTFGRYRLERCLSPGGEGGVWVADDTRFARSVVIKLLPRLLVTDEDAERRFFRGARALSRLQHPNVVTLYDIGSADPGTGEEVPFLVMEFIQGTSLDHLLADGPLPVAEGMPLMLQVARAIAAAHEAGVVHRDLKPANICVSREGHATVLDFGLARLIRTEGSAPESAITMPGMVLGSCPYMAPEQALGQTVDNTADIYSFGVVLYEVISGRRAFPGPNPVLVLQAVVGGEYSKLEEVAPHVPPTVAAIVARCMAHDPGERYPDAASLVRDLEKSCGDFQSPSARKSSEPSMSGTHNLEVTTPDHAPAKQTEPADASVRPTLSRGKRLVFVLLTALLVWLVCEAIVVVASPGVLPPVNTLDPQALVDRHRQSITTLVEGRTELFVLSPKLGWSYKPFGQKGMNRVNSMGIRSDREYTVEPPAGVLRIAAFGDSFMYGDDVEGQDTWQAQLEASDPAVEALNFGVSGYGTDQALLRYLEEGVLYSPHVVVLSYMSENNLRNLTTFRPFYLTTTGLPFAKPRFRLEDDELVLVDNPLPTAGDYQKLLADPEVMLPRIGEHDAFYGQYESSSVAVLDRSPTFRAVRFWVRRLADTISFGQGDKGSDTEWTGGHGASNRLVFEMLDAFYEQAEANGSRAIVMLFPTHFDYRNRRKGHDLSYANVAGFLDSKGYAYIDMAEVFEGYLDGGGVEADLFAFGVEGGHYSAVAHGLIAQAMRADLLAHPPESPTTFSND